MVLADYADLHSGSVSVGNCLFLEKSLEVGRPHGSNLRRAARDFIKSKRHLGRPQLSNRYLLSGHAPPPCNLLCFWSPSHKRAKHGAPWSGYCAWYVRPCPARRRLWPASRVNAWLGRGLADPCRKTTTPIPRTKH